MISCPRAGDVEEVALGVADFLQIGTIADGFDAFLQGDDLVVAGHYNHGTKLRAEQAVGLLTDLMGVE